MFWPVAVNEGQTLLVKSEGPSQDHSASSPKLARFIL
jgi:hypothetical protein